MIFLPTAMPGMVTDRAVVKRESNNVDDILYLWSFDESTGSTVKDYGPSEKHGTLVSSPLMIGTPTGGGIALNGSTQYMFTAITSNAQFLDKVFTVCVRFKFTTTSTTILIGKGTNACCFRINTASGKLSCTTKSNAAVTSMVRISNTSVNDNAWHTCCVVFSTSTTTQSTQYITIYIDGKVDQGALTQTAGVYTGGENEVVCVGARGGGSLPFPGNIADARIYSREFTDFDAFNYHYNPHGSWRNDLLLFGVGFNPWWAANTNQVVGCV